MSIRYRPYKNFDTPALASLWNATLCARGCCKSIKPFFLEVQWFSKPWFEPEALMLAVDEERPAEQQVIGAVLSGFGRNPQGCTIDRSQGVITLLLVHPDYRRKGIGKTLLHHGETYLARRGTTEGRFGCNWERFPYCWGMLGSLNPAGVLKSMEGADRFIESQGYLPRERYEVHGRPMNQAVPWGDPRFPVLRRKYEFRVGPRKVTNSLDEALHGGMETMVFELLETSIERPVAEVRAAEMTQFVDKSRPPQAGLYGLTVKPEMRRQGLGKFLLAQTLQYLNDQFYHQVETVIPVESNVGRLLFKGMGFVLIDEGTSYGKNLESVPR